MIELKKIKSKLSYTLIMVLGGILSSALGIYMLYNYDTMDVGGLPYWLLGPGFLLLGLAGLITLLDNRYALIGKDTIEMKSIFRSRKIKKADINGYGMEAYKGKYISGKRIRIFSDKRQIKFHTSQFESIDSIQQFLQGKPKVAAAFRKEQIGNVIAILMMFALLVGPVFFDKKVEESGEITSIGIPAKLHKELTLLEEQNDYLLFSLKKYQGYSFKVNKSNMPANWQTINKELVILIDNPKYIKQLNNKAAADQPNIILVDNVIVLE